MLAPRLGLAGTSLTRHQSSAESAIRQMSSHASNDPDTPDLYDQAGKQPPERPPLPPASASATATATARKYALPSDLAAALRFLTAEELARLSAAVAEEIWRREIESEFRDVKRPTAPPVTDAQMPSKPNTASAEKRKPKIPEAKLSALTPARINAVRAAFKAGMKPGTIARHFGMTQAQVRQALAGK
jgi:hypothetical protein